MKSSIKFLLNGVPKEVDFKTSAHLYPHMTVMQYLREGLKLTGTKEGCGIGDCGACTVCLAERDEAGNTVINSVNSCLIMLGMLDNKHLITVEGVAKNGELHPVQRSLKEKRGSQCGFCTPGVVMSAFSHYLNKREFTKDSVESALSGNLCRCTGYESITQALISLKSPGEKRERVELPELNCEELVFTRGESAYIKPCDLNSLLKYRAEFPEYEMVSGASDVSVKHKSEQLFDAKIIDISDISDLKRVVNEGKNLIIGSNASIECVKDILSNLYPGVNEYLSAFASLQIRNKASMAGSVAGASAVGDIMPMLLAMGAQMKLSSAGSSRVVNCREFNASYRKHILKEGEIIESFIIPVPSSKRVLFLHKQSKRKDMDISAMTFCIGFELDSGIIKNVLSGYGGMAPVPRPSQMLEEFREGRAFTEDTFMQAKDVVTKDFRTISDMRGSAGYRIMVAKNLLIKCFNDLKVEEDGPGK